MSKSLKLQPGNLDQLMSHTIQVGDVFRCKFKKEDGIVTPKPGDDNRNKYFVVLGCDNELVYGSILINSDPKPHSKFNYPLLLSKYKDLLKKNSFADCTQLKKIPISFLNSSTYKGRILPEDLALIIGCVVDDENKGVTKADLRRFDIKIEK